MAHATLNTREAASLLGVGTSTVKRWADEGILPHARTAGGHRRFKRADVESMRQRGMAPTMGDLASHRTPTTTSPEQDSAGRLVVDQWIARLLRSDDLYYLAAHMLEACARLGSWWRVASELGEVLEEVGSRWQRGELSVMDEHIATERLTRTLAWCGRTIPLPETPPHCLLLTAEGDLHTVGLALVELCAREAGWNVVWSGRQTPLDQLDGWLEHHAVGLVAVSASVASADEQDLRRQYRLLVEATRPRKISLVLGGSGAWPETLAYGYRLRTFDALHLLLSRENRL